jgi:hypothetical protein
MFHFSKSNHVTLARFVVLEFKRPGLVTKAPLADVSSSAAPGAFLLVVKPTRASTSSLNFLTTGH